MKAPWLSKTGFWLLDRLWPTLEPASPNKSMPVVLWSGINRKDIDVIETAYTAIKDQVLAQSDDFKIIESKLQNVLYLSPFTTTILVAVIVFLTGDRVKEYTPVSILIVIIESCYVVLQFVRSMVAAANGLERKPFKGLSPKDMPPKPGESSSEYMLRHCKELSEDLWLNRETINSKVSQLALAHESVKNAGVGLTAITLTIAFMTIIETKFYTVGLITLVLFVFVAILVTAYSKIRASSK